MAYILVNIASPLRKYIEGKSNLEIEASSVREVIETICKDYKDFEKVIINPNGKLNKFVSVFCGEDNINDLEHMDTKVENYKEMYIILAIAGG
jgi:molybdopterin synthase sulfur carrier subunit